MVTPGSTAPDASFTTPVILPFAFCAFAGAQIRKRPRKVVIQKGVYRPLIAFLLDVGPRGCGRRKRADTARPLLVFPETRGRNPNYSFPVRAFTAGGNRVRIRR